MIFSTYLHANFLIDPPLVEEEKEWRRPIRTLVGLGERLDPLFRVRTTGNFLKQMGLRGEIHELLDFPFAQILKSERRFGEALLEFRRVLS